MVWALEQGAWSVHRARLVAQEIANDPRGVRELSRILLGDDAEPRKRAADVARRLTEVRPEALSGYADLLASLLAEVPLEEARTRWHLGLVVPRIARTHTQRVRAARLMTLLAEERSNVVRCSAVEGMTVLARADSSFRGDAEEMIARFVQAGTPAMKSRARHARRLLERSDPQSTHR